MHRACRSDKSELEKQGQHAVYHTCTCTLKINEGTCGEEGKILPIPQSESDAKSPMCLPLISLSPTKFNSLPPNFQLRT